MWKIVPPRLIAPLPSSPTISVSQKELARDSLVSALELWPEESIPGRRGAWLMTTAKRRGISRPKGSDNIEIVGAPTSRQVSSVTLRYLSR